MKFSFHLTVAFVTGFIATLVSCGNVPTEEMLFAKSPEEFEFYLSQAHSGVHDEALRTEYLRRRLNEKSQPLLASYFGGQPGFYHGVASGDPLPDAVILWTRYTPVAVTNNVTLELRISPIIPTLPVSSHLDPALNPSLRRVNIVVTSVSDWIAKVDVTGLPSGTNFVFAFSDGTRVSEVGQTKTAPPLDADTSQLIYAVFSCANFATGYFHPYDVASTIKDLDFWIHVGDYLYEYGLYSTSSTTAPERYAQILPIWEQIDLQDYRLRQATYHLDEGLRNLRRRAPLLAIWDDHETTNNSYGQGARSNTGAQNHQEVCPVNSTATNAQKSSARCDRDEGPVDVRFTAAAQAYMEWMPIRRGPGNMGVVNITSITQVIEWGKLASVVLFDTRISYRSREPTLDSFFNFPTALNPNNTNVTAYKFSPLKEQIQASADAIQASIYNPNYTQIGENFEIMRTVFRNSKAAGKTWQIWGGGTMMAYHIGPDLSVASQLFSNATVAATVAEYMNNVLTGAGGGTARALVAMAQTSTPFNSDDFNGFGVERAKILNMVKTDSNNPIMLGGDLHDSWAWTMYEGGNKSGVPVAVNLGCPGVTSQGWGSSLGPGLAGLDSTLGGIANRFKLISDMFYQQNPGLKYAETWNRGFFVVKATKLTHHVEYIHNSPSVILSNYSAARAASGKIVGDFFCGGSLVTTAGQKGSLVRQPSCSAIQFESARPSVWSATFPSASSSVVLPTLRNCDFNACTFQQGLVGTGTESPSTSPSRSPVKAPVKAPVAAPIPVAQPVLPPANATAPVAPPANATAPAAPPANVTTPVAPITVPRPAPVPVPVPVPVPLPVRAPVPVPTPVRPPVPVPKAVPVPVPVPVNATAAPTTAPTAQPVRGPCGLFGFSIFCPTSRCGLIGRLLRLCN